MIDMLALFAGSLEAAREKPRAIFDVCPAPPLIWSNFGAGNLIALARAGIPAEIVSVPLAGAAAPVTMLGTVTQHAAECLAGITIHQLAHAGSPIVWGGAAASPPSPSASSSRSPDSSSSRARGPGSSSWRGFAAFPYDGVVEEFMGRVRQLERESYALYLAARHPRTPWYAKLFVAAVVAYAFSPIDLIPDFIPVLGYLDDLILIPLGIAVAVKLIPPEVLAECRQRAAESTAGGRPVSRTAAVVVVGIWILLVALFSLWAYEALR